MAMRWTAWASLKNPSRFIMRESICSLNMRDSILTAALARMLCIKQEDALLFSKIATLDPAHPGAHNAIGHVLFNTNNIPALLAFCRFMVLEPETNRAALNLENIQKIMNAHVTKKDEGRLSVSVSPELINGKNKSQQNDFSSTELMLALSSAADNDSSNLHKTPVEMFAL